MDVVSVPITSLFQAIKKEQLIIVGGEETSLLVSPLDHMLWLARHDETRKVRQIVTWMAYWCPWGLVVDFVVRVETAASTIRCS